MRQGAKGCGSRASWLLASCLLAAVGCEGAGGAPTPAGPTEPPGPNTDPMKIGQTELPKPDKPVDISAMDGAEFPKLNTTSFETAKALEESSGGGPVAERGVGLPVAGVATAAGAAPQQPSDNAKSPPPPSAAAPINPAGNPAAMAPADSGVMREIVEADIVQAQGDILYLLNRYRGLVLVDMSNPDSPYVRGRVPFQAQPVDMYVRDGKALIVMSDYFSYWQFDSDADPLGFHGSQVMVVDVADPSHPAVNGSFNVDGEVTDTRIVGDVLYAVSKRNPDYWRYDTQDWKDTTWVLSIDLSDPSQIHQVDKHEFPGAANLIQVYQTALSIAAIDPNYYLVDDDNVRQTKITYVDISDPKGAIRIGGSAYVPGAVEDKFKMDLSEGQLRVMSQNWYWKPDSAATLTLLDASDPTKLTQRAQIPIATDTGTGSYVQPQATRFSGKDFFVNLCWWDNSGSGVQLCRIDFYDLSNPSAPAKISALDVDGAITHFEVRGQRLLSLGTHNNLNRASSVQIALFDITNTRAPRRLAAVDLGEQGAGSAALQDYKAFKLLEDLGMILLPLSWVEMPTATQYYSRQGAQIVDWKNDTLVARGRIAQGGYVERAIAFKNRVVSISTEQIQVIDATNRDQPVQTANLFLVRNVVDVFNIKGYQVQLGASETDNSYRFFVLPFGEDDMAKSLAELPVDTSLMYQMRSGDVIYLVGSEPNTGGQLIRAADFSDPLHPRWRGQYRIADDIQHIYNGGYGGYWSFYDYYWNPEAGQPLNNQLLPVTTRVVNANSDGRRYYKNALRLIDLRDPDNLKLAAGSLQMDDFPFVNKVDHGTVLYSTHTEPALDKNGNPKKYTERYFMDRVDAADPNNLKALPKVNIPGRLVDVDAAGKLLYTVDYQWDEHGRRRNSFNVLRLDGDVATLVTVLPVGDEIDRARYLDREIWLSTHSYPWYGRNDDSPDSRQPYTRLTRLRLDEQGVIAGQGYHDVAGYHFDLLDVDGPRVYLASTYPTGLLILDTTDIEKPEILGASRTVGYVSKLVREGDALYLPMGSYGVRRVSIVP
jgi:hypothetical protein